MRLGPKTESARGYFEGWVEEVDTGKKLAFRSTEDLLRFIGGRFEEALRREREGNQSNK